MRDDEMSFKEAKASYRQLSRDTGISIDVLRLARVKPGTKPRAAQRIVQGLVSASDWDRAMTAEGLKGQTILVRALQRRAASDESPDEDEPDKPRKRRDDESEHTADDEPDPNEGELCEREGCGHEVTDHRGGTGRCKVKGCVCSSFVVPHDERGDDDEEPPPTPEERARAERIVARSDSTLTVEQVIAAERAQFGRPSPRATKASSSQTVVARTAARTGKSEAEVRRIYDAQFGKGRR